jgi:GT2 family glycosyltransferase/peptidoglycan/xylan/chitin deacetylase (PgdA/CDA1 family)
VRFSVVIPTHQRRETVLRNVAALASQSYEDFEVVVVVDGSTDGSASALRALSPAFPLTVLEQPNRGAGAARNAGAAAARGEILLFLDDDMEADPSLLSEHDRSHGEGADLVMGDLPLHPDSPSNVLTRGVATWARSRGERLAATEGEIPLADLLTGQMSISREAFERLGGFDASFTEDGSFGGEDVDFGYRVLTAGCEVRFNPAAVSRQYFEVDPADYLRREYEAGLAAQQLRAKHPERGEQIAGGLRFRSRRSRWGLAPFLIAPRAFSVPLRSAVAWLVRSGRGGARLASVFQAVRTMEHLRGVRAAGKLLSTGHVVVLAYHSIADLSHDPVLREYGVPPGRFAEQLDVLVHRGWTFVDMDALLAALRGEQPLSGRALLLTFDDAYAELRTVALPLLEERGIAATVFAVAGHVGGVNEWDRAKGAGELALLDADGLRTLSTNGLEIGSHASSHRPLTRVPRDELDRELDGSAAGLESLGVPRPRALAYPHGAWSPEVAAEARRAGYAVAFTVAPGVVRRGVDSHALPRIEVLASDTPWKLRVKLATAEWPPRRRTRALALLRVRS